MDYKKVAEKIMESVGERKNIKGYTNCITRLRISINNLDNVDLEELKAVEEVLGLNKNGDELQLIFGPGKVKKAYIALDELYKSTSRNQVRREKRFKDTVKNQKNDVKAKRTSKFQGFMANFSNIFIPLIPGFIAAGLLGGLAGLCSELDITGDWVNYINVFNKSLTKFMYIMIGFNATKTFGGSGIIGGILSGLFLLGYGGSENSGMTEFFGQTIEPRGGMIGVLFTTIIAAKFEIFIRDKFSWEPTDMITTPIITLLGMGILTYILIMPLSFKLFSLMNYTFVNLNGNPIGGGILAGLFLPSVMMGIHQGFVPVYQGLLETTGMNSLFPILAMGGAGQVGAALALYVKSPKKSNLRENIRGAIVPGFLGIGEPLIYGVTLPRVKPFFTSMAGGAIGGIYIGIMSQIGFTFGLNTVFGSSGILGLLAMISNSGALMAINLYLSALIIAYISGFIFTYLFGCKNVDLS